MANNKSKKKKSPNKAQSKPKTKVPENLENQDEEISEIDAQIEETAVEENETKKPESKKSTSKKDDAKSEGKFNKILRSIGRFFKDFKNECKKIVWSSRSDTIKNTGVVLMIVVLIGIGIWIADFGLTELRQLLYSLAEKGSNESMISLSSIIGL